MPFSEYSARLAGDAGNDSAVTVAERAGEPRRDFGSWRLFACRTSVTIMIAGLGERESGRQAYVDSTTGDDCRLRAYRGPCCCGDSCSPGREPDASGDDSPVLEMRRVEIDVSAHCREHPASVSPGAAGRSARWMKSELGSPLPTHKLVRGLMLRGLSRLILSTSSHRVFFAHRAGARRTLEVPDPLRAAVHIGPHHSRA
jgi:hypothetical protein